MNPTVRQFLDAGGQALSLRVAGEGGHLDRRIPELSLNRPGLALTGFLRYFAHRRVQVFGLAEMTFLKSLSPEDRQARLRKFFSRSVPCVVIARSLRPLPGMVEEAQRTQTPLLRSALVTGDFLQRGAILIDDLAAPNQRIQGTMVDLMGIGVLMEGSPGVGKSEAALSLIARGYSLVSDDVTELRRIHPGALLASAPESTRYHMDIRGLGIVHVPSLYGVASVRRSKRLDMIVHLRACDPRQPCGPTAFDTEHRDILGVSVPCVVAPVSPGRDAAQMVVTAALNFRLRELGHDAVKELDQKLIQRMAREGRGKGD